MRWRLLFRTLLAAVMPESDDYRPEELAALMTSERLAALEWGFRWLATQEILAQPDPRAAAEKLMNDATATADAFADLQISKDDPQIH